MEYKCIECNYASHDKFNYKRHLNTVRHQKKVSQSSDESMLNPERIQTIHKCSYCENVYSTASNLSKHKSKCQEKTALITKYERIIDSKNTE